MKNMLVSHKKSNSKSAILFTICLAYLIFGGSSLLLINNLVLGVIKNLMGADLFVGSFAGTKTIPEEQLRKYLYESSLGESPKILTYTFGSFSMTQTMIKYGNINTKFKLYQKGGHFPRNRVYIIPVEEHYLESVFDDYYIPHTEQTGLDYPKIGGKNDVVWSLYSDQGTTDFEGGYDKYNISSRTLTDAAQPVHHEPMKQIKMLLPEGIDYYMSAKSGQTMKLHAYSPHSVKEYQGLVRAMPRKIPGFAFTSYSLITFGLEALISYDQAFDIFLDMLIGADHELERNITDYKS